MIDSDMILDALNRAIDAPKDTPDRFAEVLGLMRRQQQEQQEEYRPVVMGTIGTMGTKAHKLFIEELERQFALEIERTCIPLKGPGIMEQLDMPNRYFFPASDPKPDKYGTPINQMERFRPVNHNSNNMNSSETGLMQPDQPNNPREAPTLVRQEQSSAALGPTRGQVVMAVNFNPGQRDDVACLKQIFADCFDEIDKWVSVKDKQLEQDVRADVMRLAALAKTNLETAQMYAVKAVTR